MRGEPKARSTGTAAALPWLFVLLAAGFNVFLLGKVAPAVAHSYGQALPQLTGALVMMQLAIVSGGLMIGPIGRVLSPRCIIPGALAVVGVAGLITPLATEFGAFILLRIMAGFCLGVAVPFTLARLATWRDGKGLIGIGLASQSFGSFSATLLLAKGLPMVGWQAFFGLAGGLAIIACLWLTVGEAKPEMMSSPSQPDRPAGGLRRTDWPALGIFAMLFLITVGVATLIGSWGATLFFFFRGVALTHFAAVSVLALGCNVAGLLLSGKIATLPRPERQIAMCMALQGASLCTMAKLGFGSTAFVAAMCISAFAQACNQGLLNILVSFSFARDCLPPAFGWMGAFAKLGAVMGALVGGILLSMKIPLGIILGSAAGLCFSCGVIVVLAMAMGLLGRYRIT